MLPFLQETLRVKIYLLAMLRVLCTRWAYKRSIQQRGNLPRVQTLSRTPRVPCFSSVAAKKLESDKNVNSLNRNGEFEIIYKFPHIALVRGVCRLKIYQSTITFVSVPIISYFSYLGILTSQDVIFTLTSSGLALLMLLVMGEFFRKFVGHIYYNSQKDLVKISHLTFWGRRNDIIVPREDLAPFSDEAVNLKDIYIPLHRYSESNNLLYISLRFGGVTNLKKFIDVFGELEDPSLR
ncbi:transmembrane protein 186 [Palaemon carinicauda]|uniref:transmembrane protein 186 n=1 Tax=Palaemon carinicauda TaxID=392227 RepID=UPI0035B5F62E